MMRRDGQKTDQEKPSRKCNQHFDSLANYAVPCVGIWQMVGDACGMAGVTATRLAKQIVQKSPFSPTFVQRVWQRWLEVSIARVMFSNYCDDIDIEIQNASMVSFDEIRHWQL